MYLFAAGLARFCEQKKKAAFTSTLGKQLEFDTFESIRTRLICKVVCGVPRCGDSTDENETFIFERIMSDNVKCPGFCLRANF